MKKTRIKVGKQKNKAGLIGNKIAHSQHCEICGVLEPGSIFNFAQTILAKCATF